MTCQGFALVCMSAEEGRVRVYLNASEVNISFLSVVKCWLMVRMEL